MLEVLLPRVVLVPRPGRLMRLRGTVVEPYEYGDREYAITLTELDAGVAVQVRGSLVFASRRGKELADLEPYHLHRLARSWGAFQVIYYPRLLDRLGGSLTESYQTSGPVAWQHHPVCHGSYELTSNARLKTAVPFPHGLESLLNTITLQDVTATYKEPRP